VSWRDSLDLKQRSVYSQPSIWKLSNSICSWNHSLLHIARSPCVSERHSKFGHSPIGISPWHALNDTGLTVNQSPRMTCSPLLFACKLLIRCVVVCGDTFNTGPPLRMVRAQALFLRPTSATAFSSFTLLLFNTPRIFAFLPSTREALILCLTSKSERCRNPLAYLCTEPAPLLLAVCQRDLDFDLDRWRLRSHPPGCTWEIFRAMVSFPDSKVLRCPRRSFVLSRRHPLLILCSSGFYPGKRSY